MIEPRDRDGFLAKDRPEDIVRDEPSLKYDDWIHERNLMAYGALGMLQELLDGGRIPEHHIAQAKRIIAAYEVADAQVKAMRP